MNLNLLNPNIWQSPSTKHGFHSLKGCDGGNGLPQWCVSGVDTRVVVTTNSKPTHIQDRSWQHQRQWQLGASEDDIDNSVDKTMTVQQWWCDGDNNNN